MQITIKLRHLIWVWLAILAIVLLILIVPTFVPLKGGAHGPCWDVAPRCDRINAWRINHGRRAVVQHADLQHVAELWAKSMAASGLLAHNPDLGAQLPPLSGTYGEDVGYGPSSYLVMNAFRDSPKHWAIILDRDFRRVGIGYEKDPTGRVWLVLVFAAT